MVLLEFQRFTIQFNSQRNSAAHTAPDTTTTTTTTPKVEPTGKLEEKKLLCETFKFGALNNLIIRA